MPPNPKRNSVLLFAQAAMQVGRDSMKLLDRTADPDAQVARVLVELGAGNRGRVAFMGDALADEAWAYIAGVRIVAEVPPEDIGDFWAANVSQKKDVLAWLASTGASVLVTRSVPETAMAMGWKKAPETDYYLLRLTPDAT